jgi:LEA14-like dessication related protein
VIPKSFWLRLCRARLSAARLPSAFGPKSERRRTAGLAAGRPGRFIPRFMKKFWLTFLPLLLAAAFLTSCTNGFRLSNIRVTVTDFRPLSATLLETRAAMTIRYVNENVTSFAIAGSRHKLYLNGTYVGRAVTDEPIGLQRLNTTTQTVTVNLENLKLLQQLQTLPNSSMVTYRLESDIFVSVADDTEKVKSTSSGQLDLAPFLNLK